MRVREARSTSHETNGCPCSLVAKHGPERDTKRLDLQLQRLRRSTGIRPSPYLFGGDHRDHWTIGLVQPNRSRSAAVEGGRLRRIIKLHFTVAQKFQVQCSEACQPTPYRNSTKVSGVARPGSRTTCHIRSNSGGKHLLSRHGTHMTSSHARLTRFRQRHS